MIFYNKCKKCFQEFTVLYCTLLYEKVQHWSIMSLVIHWTNIGFL